jgi:cardiolipin synthase
MKNLNVPNVLTMIRMLMIPLFVYLFFLPIERNMFYAALVYAVAALTDYLDGMIARKYNLVTKFGKLFDPLADKLLQLTAVGCLVYVAILPAWFLFFYIAKEVLQIIAGAYLLKHNVVISSNLFGKIASVMFYVATAAFLLFEITVVLKNIILVAVIFMSLLAFIKYAIEFRTQACKLTQSEEE